MKFLKIWFLLIFISISIYIICNIPAIENNFNSIQKWKNQSIKADDLDKIHSLCENWKTDLQFQDQIQKLPDNPAYIEYMINNGWNYHSDSDIYGSLDYYPSLSEIKFELPSPPFTLNSRISFVGDCTTKTILLGNILSCKGIPFKIIHTLSYNNKTAHMYITYEGRLNAQLITYTSTQNEIVNNDQHLLFKTESNNYSTKIFSDNDLVVSYEQENEYYENLYVVIKIICIITSISLCIFYYNYIIKYIKILLLNYKEQLKWIFIGICIGWILFYLKKYIYLIQR